MIGIWKSSNSWIVTKLEVVGKSSSSKIYNYLGSHDKCDINKENNEKETKVQYIYKHVVDNDGIGDEE